MIYAMFSIGILGFLVWSLIKMMGSLNCEIMVTNLAICWNSSVLVNTACSQNLISYTLSAGNRFNYSYNLNYFSFMKEYINSFKNSSLKNRNIHTSSSETTREESFKFDNFFETFNSLNSNLHTKVSFKWLEWFIGFTEGDGSIVFTNNKPRFVLTQKEGDILKEIKKIFGFGEVRYFPQGYSGNKNGFYRWIVSEPLHLYILALLFNGNLHIESKILQLERWIAFLNKRNNIFIHEKQVKPINIIKKNLKVKLNNAWLSGLTDAEGCFNVSILNSTRYSSNFVVRLRFILDQQCESLLKDIYLLFGFGSVTLRNKTNGVYRYTSTGFMRMISIRNYFDRFPLKTKKLNSFINWSKIHSMLIAKEHLSSKGLENIRILKKSININNSLNNKTGASLAQ